MYSFNNLNSYSIMLVAIKGKKGSGKTSFIEKLLKNLEGYRMVVIKKSGHEEIDIKGKDTYRYKEAGAAGSIVVAKSECALFFRGDINYAIYFAKKLQPDLIIVEGSINADFVINVEDEPDLENVIKVIKERISMPKIDVFVDGKKLILNRFVKEIFYKTIKAMLSCLKGGDGKRVEIFISGK